MILILFPIRHVHTYASRKAFVYSNNNGQSFHPRLGWQGSTPAEIAAYINHMLAEDTFKDL